MRVLATLIATIVFIAGFGQSAQLIDSIELNLETYPPDDKAFALFTLVSYYQRSDQKKTLQYREQAAGFLIDVRPKARTYARIIEGIYYSGVGALDSAEYWFTQAKESALQMHDNKTTATICSSLGRTMIAAGKAAHKTRSTYQLWQEGYHPQAIYSDRTMLQKIDYIHANPVRRGWVASPEHWRYSSAHEWLPASLPVIRCDQWR